MAVGFGPRWRRLLDPPGLVLDLCHVLDVAVGVCDVGALAGMPVKVAGHTVTLFEEEDSVGGYLRFGI